MGHDAPSRFFPLTVETSVLLPILPFRSYLSFTFRSYDLPRPQGSSLTLVTCLPPDLLLAPRFRFFHFRPVRA